MRSCSISIVLMVATASLNTACGHSPTAPTKDNPPGGSPSLVSLSMTVPVSFTAIGETAQLRATGGLSDDTTIDLTDKVLWTSSSIGVAVVATGGLLTVKGYGQTSIKASYQSKTATRTISVTPTGSFVVTGRVREPEHSGVPGALITEIVTGQSVRSDSNGAFTIGNLTAGGALRVERTQFEPVEVALPTSSPSSQGAPVAYDIPLQRIVAIAAGQSITPPPIAAHDVQYTMRDGTCNPCRMIRISVPASGMLNLVISSPSAQSRLSAWVDGIRLPGMPESSITAALHVRAGETKLYIAAPPVITSYAQIPPAQIAVETRFDPDGA